MSDFLRLSTWYVFDPRTLSLTSLENGSSVIMVYISFSLRELISFMSISDLFILCCCFQMSHCSLCLCVDLRPLPDVAMTGNCTHECTEFGHSDSCWMPGQPSPTRKVSKNAPKLSTFVPYQEMDGQEQLMANGSPKPLATEERGTGSGGSSSSKVANMRFMTPYSSAYPGGGDSSGKDCGLEEIPLSQGVEYHSATTPTGQTSKREIYL